jgi:hypothetical protein
VSGAEVLVVVFDVCVCNAQSTKSQSKEFKESRDGRWHAFISSKRRVSVPNTGDGDDMR